MDLDALLSLFIDSPALVALVSAVVGALVLVGLKVAAMTSTTADDTILGFLADLLRLRKPVQPPASVDPEQEKPLLVERTSADLRKDD